MINKEIDFSTIDLEALDGGDYEYNVWFNVKMMPIFTYDIANFLLRRGHRMLKIMHHHNGSGALVFMF